MNLVDKVKLLITLGFRNILRSPKRTMLVVSAAGTGMTGIILMFAFMNGFYLGMIDQGVETGLGHAQIRPAGYLKIRKDSLTLDKGRRILTDLHNMAKSPAAPENFRFAPRFEREGLLRMGGETRGVVLIGIDPILEGRISKFKEQMIEGVMPGEKETRIHTVHQGVIPCAIGRANAKKLDVGRGDSVILSMTDENGDTRSFRARVSGVFGASVPGVEKYTVLVKREDLARMYGEDESITGYFVILGSSLKKVNELKAWLQKELGAPNIEILTYEELEPMITRMLELSDQFNWITYIIMMFGFGLILFDSVSMSVFERMREIGILRALGTRPGFIFWMIMFETWLLTFVGALLGLLLGGTLTLYFYSFGLSLASFAEGMETFGKSMTIVYPFLTLKDLGQAFQVTLVISLIAGIYPAIKALRLTPVRAIYNR